MSLFDELKRRNVFRVAFAYLVIGWLLTEVLTTLLPAFGAPEWASKAVILTFALGFLPMIVLSWIYEITPDGIRKDNEVDRDDAATGTHSRRLEFFTIAAVIAGVVFIAIFSSWSEVDGSSERLAQAANASVAVLPFVNMSGDADNDYFSDGLTETLLHMLAQIPELKVAARTSSFAFRNQDKTIIEIANALTVAHVLEGSVQRSGDRVRITAQLIRASDGFHVWSESYDRTLDDIFAIQDEIAEKVGGALSASLLGDAPGTAVADEMTSIPDAFDLYLQALQSRSTYSYGGLEAEEGLLKGALAIDPDFLQAKVALASNYWHQVETGLMDQRSAHPQIIAITNQVLVVQPDDVDARALQVFVNAVDRAGEKGPRVFVTAVAELEEIVAAAPAEFFPRVLLTRFYQALQQFDKSVVLMQEALQRDPYNARIHFELGTLFVAMRRWNEARAALQKSLEIEPAQPNALANLARVSLQTGDGLGYLRQFLRAIEVDPADYELPGTIAGFLYELGLIEEGDDFRDRVLAIAPTSAISYQVELLRAINIGDEEGSIASARRAIEDDIDDRQFSFGGAVQHLLRVAASRGTVDEESAFLEQHAPNILNIGEPALPLKYRQAQFAAFDAWYVALPREEMLRRLEQMRKTAKSYGFEPEQDPQTHVGMLALEGNTEQAVEVALTKLFSQPVAANLGWRRMLAQAQFAGFVKDPRIQAAMQRWDDEEAVLREQISKYLAELSIAS